MDAGCFDVITALREQIAERRVTEGWDDLPPVLTPDQVRRVLPVGRTALYEQMRHGILSKVAFRLGRRWLIDKEGLMRLIRERTQ